jgi:F0F1-type ATP synthase assembly protein I
MTQSDKDRRNIINTFVIVLVGQGCATLLVAVLSVWGGLWLDNTFHTKPVFTLVLLLAGMPVAVVLMIYVMRRTLARLKAQDESFKQKDSSL